MAFPGQIPPPHRRGTAYILVLGASMLVALLGISAIALSRIDLRRSAYVTDASTAQALAISAVEHCIARLATDANWRTTYTNNVEIGSIPMGRGSFKWKLVDTGDGNLADNAMDSVVVHGTGTAGSAVRVYTATLAVKGTGLDVLKTVAHAAGAISQSSTVSASGGPFSTNANINVIGTINGSVDAASRSGPGSITGTATIPATAKTMPGADNYDTYLGQATPIPFASLSAGTIQNTLISASSNPYGSLANNGIYSIQVPANSSLTLRNSRLKATLIVSLGAGADLKTLNAVLWEPARSDAPALIVKATGAATVTLNGSATTLNESSTANMNPSHTPFRGTSDTDATDIYPPELRGLYHVIGAGTTTTLGSGLIMIGTLVTEGTLTINGSISLRTDTRLYSNPPTGYSATGTMQPASGSFQWANSP